MSEIAISGYYGFSNAGDEAMLAAMIEVLGDLAPEATITVISGNPDDTRRRHGVQAVHRLDVPSVMRLLKRSKLLISGGGSLLQDVTSERSLYYYLGVMWLAKRLGTPVMLYSQGIGPVCGSLAQRVMRYVGNEAALITVRDEGSLEELRRLHILRPPQEVTADPVLAMHPVDKGLGRVILKRHGLEGTAPLVGLAIREWQGWDGYKEALAQAADRLVESCGARIVFLPMQSTEDIQAARKVQARMKQHSVVLQDAYTTGELLSLVGNLDVLLGIRLHALIFAAIMQVPLIGISYDPKIERFLSMLGEKPIGSLRSLQAAELSEAVQALLQNPARPWLPRMKELRDKAYRAAELAVDLLNKKQG